jgi:hypothetical protein
MKRKQARRRFHAAHDLENRNKNMNRHGHGVGLALRTLAPALGVLVLGLPPRIEAGDCTAVTQSPGQICAKCGMAHRAHATETLGTLGYGPPGLHPGFQGFGLGYHLGYGYGGKALGTGAGGGYPFYGGPGYPHPWPRLRRFGKITPFPHFAGPGYPTPEQPQYFGGVGPLALDPPVIKVEAAPGQPGYPGDYGSFTGMVPYPESQFAPFTSAAGGVPGSSMGSPYGASETMPVAPAPRAPR